MNNTMKKLILVLVAVGYIIHVNAQNDYNEERNIVAISGALTSCYTWQLEVSYHYKVCSYIRIGASMGMWKQYVADGYPTGKGWRVSDDDEEVENFYIRPSLQLVSPPIIHFSEGNLAFLLEPGCMMNIPYNKVNIAVLNEYGMITNYKKISSNKGRWYAFDYKIGFSLDLGSAGISGGYMYSNLDIFAMNRRMKYNGKAFDEFYPRPQKIHGGFLSLYYYF